MGSHVSKILKAVALGAAGALVLAACSSSSSAKSDSSSSTANATGAKAAAAFTRPACKRPVAPAADVKPVAGSTTEFDVTMADGTVIRAHWFPRDTAAASPTILKGPGWGIAGDTNTQTTGAGLFGDTSISSLHDAGYNVLTWDPRGFGKSTGTITVNSADHEGRDVERLLDWIATQPGVQLDATGDPRVGMVGGSYGGGIQLILAAIDCRVDAIVPTIAWHSLGTSLSKASTYKAGWNNTLYGTASARNLDPHIVSGHDAGNGSGVLSAEDKQWFLDRGPGDLIKQINIPTLFVQGTVDTLFTLDEAVTNYRILRDKGVPTGMLWYCGGHGVCLTKGGDSQRANKVGFAWLTKYLKGDKSADTGPRFGLIDQNGAEFGGADYPLALGPPVVANGSGSLTLQAAGGAGPIPPGSAAGALAGIASSFTPAKATNAVNVVATIGSTPVTIAGPPKLTITYTGTTPAGEKPTRVFAQIVDDASGPRAREPDHADQGGPGRQVAHDHGAARDGGVLRATGRNADLADRCEHARVRRAAPGRDG